MKKKKRVSICHIWKPTVLHVRYITPRLLQQLCLSLRFLRENSSKLHFILSLLLYFFTVYDLILWSEVLVVFCSPIWFDFSQMLLAAIGPRPTHFSCDIFDRVLGTLMYFSTNVLRATRGARNPKLQVVITHASHVCSHHSFGLQLRMNGTHRTQFDHARLDLLSPVIWPRVFWLSVAWNLCKVQRCSKSVLTFDRCRPHSVTFGYY